MNLPATERFEETPEFVFNEYKRDRFVIFLHIQKTAGMTVQRYLRKRFGPGILKSRMWKLTQDVRLTGSMHEAAKARTAADGFFAGHFCFGMHRNLPNPSTYMGFLREPISRVISLYKYSRDDRGAYYHGYAKSSSLYEFVNNSGLMELDNGMVRFLAGSNRDHFINRAPVGSVDQAMLNKAIENLDRYFFFVGIQEMFDASFLLLAKRLGDTKPRYLTLNESNKTRRTELSNEALEAIKASNVYDFALYDYAKKKLMVELNAELPNLDRELAELKRRNRAYAERQTRLSNLISRWR